MVCWCWTRVLAIWSPRSRRAADSFMKLSKLDWTRDSRSRVNSSSASFLERSTFCCRQSSRERSSCSVTILWFSPISFLKVSNSCCSSAKAALSSTAPFPGWASARSGEVRGGGRAPLGVDVTRGSKLDSSGGSLMFFWTTRARYMSRCCASDATSATWRDCSCSSS
uniref:Uncharacterized protein n=1 Tax=Ixodes ricinus TaxID=34613 RepID=A0A6B0UXM9_IXORI